MGECGTNASEQRGNGHGTVMCRSSAGPRMPCSRDRPEATEWRKGSIDLILFAMCRSKSRALTVGTVEGRSAIGSAMSTLVIMATGVSYHRQPAELVRSRVTKHSKLGYQMGVGRTCMRLHGCRVISAIPDDLGVSE